MNKQQFRNLIREEIKKALNEDAVAVTDFYDKGQEPVYSSNFTESSPLEHLVHLYIDARITTDSAEFGSSEYDQASGDEQALSMILKKKGVSSEQLVKLVSIAEKTGKYPKLQKSA